MAVQKDYRVPGMRTEEVRALQRMIGVTVDGAWGKQSQAALDLRYGANADPLKIFKGIGNAAGRSGTGAASAVQQYGQLPNGYTGTYYTKGGNNYTEYGALLRNDGYHYTPGAKISPNGMYEDTGNGWQFAKLGSMAGAAPGSRIPGFSSGGRLGGADNSGIAEPEPNTNQPKSEWEIFFEQQLKQYMEELLSGYVE